MNKEKRQSKSVVLLGSGGVAHSIAKALSESSHHRLTTVYSRNLDHAKELVLSMGSSFGGVTYATDRMDRVPQEADLYIIAVSDGAIASISESLVTAAHSVVVHTSAATPLQVLASHKNIAVLYPPNTFSKTKPLSFKHFSFLTECATPLAQKRIRDLLNDWGAQGEETSFEKRQIFHLAAVFACNFTNHCYAIAHQILSDHQLPTALLNPIIKETALKAIELSPLEGQTGPAIRHDLATIARHLEVLRPAETTKWFKIYELMTLDIMRTSSEKDSL